MSRTKDDLAGTVINTSGWEARFYRTPKGNLRIVTGEPYMWQVVVDYATAVVATHQRRSAMHTAYRAKTRRRNRR